MLKLLLNDLWMITPGCWSKKNMEISHLAANNNQHTTLRPNSTVNIIKNKMQKEPVKTAVIGGSSLLVLIIAIAKRKAIGRFFKNIFKKEKQQAPATEQVKPKIELPKPNFTAGKENPEQFAKEKAEYIKSIWDEFLDVNPPFKPINKEKNILGLQALQKYGTRDDLLKLSKRYQLSEDSDIMKEYAKLVGIVGKDIDCLPILAKIGRKDVSYTESTLAEMLKTLKVLMVDKSAPKYWENFDYNKYTKLEKLTKHTNKDISDNAKAITKRLVEDNPWMLE